MRKLNKIIIHCSDTPKGREHNVEDIRRWHKEKGWSDIGYHYLVLLDGTIEEGRPLEKAGAHAKGYNSTSIGICYVGGKGGDTRTKAQNGALVKLVFTLKTEHNISNENIIGHCDVSNKKCPQFDVKKWVKDLKWED